MCGHILAVFLEQVLHYSLSSRVKLQVKNYRFIVYNVDMYFGNYDGSLHVGCSYLKGHNLAFPKWLPFYSLDEIRYYFT